MARNFHGKIVLLWRWAVPRPVRVRLSWLRGVFLNLGRKWSHSKARDWLTWVERGNRIALQSRNGTDWEAEMLVANDKYLKGVRYQELQPHFEAAAQMQDSLSSSSGLDGLSFRTIGYKHWGSGIGHLSLLDVLAKLRILGLLTPQERILDFGNGYVSNPHYLDLISKLFPSISLDKDKQAAFQYSTQSLQESVSFFRLKSGVSLLYPAVSLAHRSWHNRDPLLRLSDEDVEWGKSELSRICSEKVEWFVTFHIRTGSDKSRSAPNSDVVDYISAMKAVVDCGGTAVRTGGREMPPLPEVRGIVDYAHSESWSSKMNTYLMAECRFFVGTASGPLTVPHSFGVPTLYTNAPAVGLVPDFPKTLTMPRKYAEESSGRILHVQEVLESPAAWTVNPAAYPSLRTIDNTPEELREAVVEMLHLTASETFRSTDMSGDQRIIHETLRQSVGDYSGVRVPESFIAGNRKNFV